MNNYLKETKLLNYNNDSIQKLIAEKGWKNLNEKNKIMRIYDFVRDEIKFGYNIDDIIPASKILPDGYGVATDNFSKPQIYWNENDTYIQKEGIKKDFGVYDDPDSFFKVHSQDMNFIKRFFYRYITRHLMNRNVSVIRNS